MFFWGGGRVALRVRVGLKKSRSRSVSLKRSKKMGKLLLSKLCRGRGE